MQIKQKNLVDGNIYAYLLIDYKTSEILDGNKMARQFYKKDGHFPELENLFIPNQQGDSLANTIKIVPMFASTVLNNITSAKADGTTFLAHLELCKIDETVLLLVVKENFQLKISKVNEIIELTDNPIFQMKQDEFFTSTYGSPRFYHSIRLTETNFQEHNHASFLSLLRTEQKGSFASRVNKELELHGECDITVELQVESESESGQLYQFNAFQSIYDKKIYGVLIGIKKQSDLLKKIEYDQQYFDVMQK